MGGDPGLRGAALGELETPDVQEHSGKENNHALQLRHRERTKKSAIGISA